MIARDDVALMLRVTNDTLRAAVYSIGGRAHDLKCTLRRTGRRLRDRIEQAREDARDLEALDAENDRLGREVVELRARLASCTLPWCDVPALQRELEELRLFDARVLLRCPECGEWARVMASAPDNWWGFCPACQRDGPQADDPLAALLAWHGRE